MSQEQATVAEEEYLQIIYWLQEAGLPITGANIARAMQVSAPTVHEMIGRLEADGYVTRGADKSLEFTDSGQEHAAGIVRRHRLIERFLTDVFDIPWDQVHEEAERLEHWMSPMVEERMLRAIGDAKTCPHGHPIFEGEREDGVPLADVEEGANVRVLRFENEAEDLLHYLKDTGLTPGLEGTLARARRRRDRRGRRRHLALGHALGRRDGVRRGRSLAAAAHRTAGSARARPRALRPVARGARSARPAPADSRAGRGVPAHRRRAARGAARGRRRPEGRARRPAAGRGHGSRRGDRRAGRAAVEPALVATAGPRYFGFVVGGSLDAATARRPARDRLGPDARSTPSARRRRPPSRRWSAGGSRICSACRPTRRSASSPAAQGANTVALAAARHQVLARRRLGRGARRADRRADACGCWPARSATPRSTGRCGCSASERTRSRPWRPTATARSTSSALAARARPGRPAADDRVRRRRAT